MFVRRTLWLALLGAIVLCAGCSHSPGRRRAVGPPPTKTATATTPKSLIVLSGAKNTMYYHRGTEQVLYELTAAYPATEALAEISDKLAKQGWKPLEEDFMNPGQPSSHVAGWTFFVDGSHSPEQEVRQWLAEWTNGAGDIVTYTLRYQSPVGSPANNDKLNVSAIYMSAKMASAYRSSIKK